MPLGPDFRMVQLSAEGAAFANGHPLGCHDGRFTFNFLPSTPVKAALYEWEMFLSKQVTPAGQPLFEVVADPAAPETA